MREPLSLAGGWLLSVKALPLGTTPECSVSESNKRIFENAIIQALLGT